MNVLETFSNFKKSSITPVILIIVFSFIIIWPFFKNGYFKTDDGEWMIIRFSAFHQTLIAGQLPVRFIERLNNNYGYPVTNFLYPLPFYLAEVLYLLTKNFTLSIKILYVISTFLSGLLMYWALRQKFNIAPSTLGAIYYLFFPYRLIDLYVRGSLGEVVALAFAPLALGAIIKISEGKKIFYPILAVTLAILITSHNVIAATLLPFLTIILIILNKKNLQLTILTLLLGAGLAAFYWIPAIYDLRYVRLLSVNVSNPVEYLAKIENIFSPLPISSKSIDLYPYIGLSIIPIILCAIYLWFKNKKDTLALVSTVVILICIFMMTNFSKLIWENVYLINVIQFPWRLSATVMFFSSILAAYVFHEIKHFLPKLIIFLLLILSIVHLLQPKEYTNMDDSYYSTNEDTTTVKDEYLPIWVDEKPSQRANEKFVQNNNILFEQVETKPSSYKTMAHVLNPTVLVINTIYFPGHEVKVNNKNVTIMPTQKNGLISLELPSGKHEVIIKYGKTPIHKISETVSLISILLTVFVIIYQWRKKDF